MRIILLIWVVFNLVACDSGIPKENVLEWQYDYSTDVAHFRIIRTLPIDLEKEKCNTIVWELEALQVFKGNIKVKEIVQVWGPNDPEYWSAGGERLMFLNMYVFDKDQYDTCRAYLFSNYKKVHWSCCEVTGADNSAQVQFQTMLNSEQRGADIPVNANKVFEVLRTYEAKSPNKNSLQDAVKNTAPQL